MLAPEPTFFCLIPAATPNLLDQLRDVLRVKHYSLRTNATYVNWCRRFIHFFMQRHPAEMGATDIR